MKILHLYPQGLYEGDLPFDPSQGPPCPVLLKIEGFPLHLEIKSLKGLRGFQKKQAIRCYISRHTLKNFRLFVALKQDAFVMTHVEEHPIITAIKTLTDFSYPIGSIVLDVFKEKLPFSPTLHIKSLPTGMTRLLYSDKGMPHLMRMIDTGLDEEIQETLTYIHDTFHDQPVEVTHKSLPVKSLWLSFWRLWGVNALWRLYLWPRLIACLCGIGLCSNLIFMGIYGLKTHDIQSKIHDLQTKTTLIQKNEQQPVKNYQTLKMLHRHLQRKEKETWTYILKKLYSSPPVRFDDIAWWPQKRLLLLTTFSSWKALKTFEAFLHKTWSKSKVKRIHKPIQGKDMTVQWDIQL